MSHKALRLLIRDTAKSLTDDIFFGYGKASDFNQIRNKTNGVIWLDLLSASPTFSNNNVQDYTKDWSVNLTFCELDKPDSIETQYMEILDRMDDLVDKFINKLNRFSETAEETGDITTEEIVISNISQQPFVKIFDDYRTGYTVSMNIQTPDKFEYCSLYDN
jgi:hypothetical protein